MSERFLKQYLRRAPLSLSLVRAAECEFFSRNPLEHPCLDIGCGDGLFASQVFHKPIDVGLDLSLREIGLAKPHNAYKHFSVANASIIPFRDESFQMVISNCVFEHIPGFVEAFHEIFRVLKPGGKYVFTCHSDLYNDYLLFSSLFERLGLPWLRDLYVEAISAMFKHFNCLSPEEWSRILKEAGFAEVTTEYYLSRRTAHLFDLLLPLSLPSFLCKKVLGRWTLLPRDWVYPLFRLFVNTEGYWDASAGGGALCIVATKAG